LSQETAARTTPAGRLGLFLIVVGVPLVVTPFTAAPFADPKLMILLAGATLLAFSRPRVDPVLFAASAVWVGAATLTATLGDDPTFSVLGPENQATGVIAIVAGAFLLCAATSLDARARERIPVWLFRTGVVVSALAIFGRFVDTIDWLAGMSSTFGHRVFAAGFIASALIAAIVLRRTPAFYAGVVVLASGLGVTAVRSAWIGLAVGLLVVAWRRWTTVLHVLVPVILVLAAWTLADQSLRGAGLEVSAAPRFTQVQEGSAAQRLPAIRANLRAWRDDLLLGSGPGTGWGGFLSHATAEEIREAQRGYGDAHNLPVEFAATTGLVGLLATAALGVAILVRTRRAAPDRRWGLGMAAALAVVHQFQPLNVALTPLMLFAAGLAVTLPPKRPRIQVGRWAAVVLAAGLVLAGNRLIASQLEKHGATYASEPALRWSLTLERWRIRVPQLLAQHRAFDHLSGDRSAAADARRLVRDNVRRHDWSPSTRLVAANIESILDDDRAARRWLEEHLRIFPNDPVALAGAASLAARDGDHEHAASLARRALRADPGSALAGRVFRQARARR
jgi:hypothetical protein